MPVTLLHHCVTDTIAAITPSWLTDDNSPSQATDSAVYKASHCGLARNRPIGIIVISQGLKRKKHRSVTICSLFVRKGSGLEGALSEVLAVLPLKMDI